MSVVSVAIFEGDFAWPIETFAVYLTVLGGGRYFPFPGVVQYFSEFDG